MLLGSFFIFSDYASLFMDTDTIRLRMRDYLAGRLAEKGDTQPFSDQELLISGGRLDSLEAVQLVVFLEDQFGVDFSRIDFDKSLLDSVDALVALAMPGR